jgi:hypothetical protein
VEFTLALAGLDYRKYVVIDPALYRPAEVNVLQGNAAKARNILGWRPEIGFGTLVREMLATDLRAHGLDENLLSVQSGTDGVGLSEQASLLPSSEHPFELAKVRPAA